MTRPPRALAKGPVECGRQIKARRVAGLAGGHGAAPLPVMEGLPGSSSGTTRKRTAQAHAVRSMVAVSIKTFYSQCH